MTHTLMMMMMMMMMTIAILRTDCYFICQIRCIYVAVKYHDLGTLHIVA